MDIPEAGVLKTSRRYFFTPSSLAEELLYYPTRVGHYFCDCHYDFSHRAETARLASHRLNFMLVCVLNGELHFTFQDGKANAGPGQISLFDCRQPHRYTAQDGTEFAWLLFNGLNAQALYQRIIQSKAGRHVFAPGDFLSLARGIIGLADSCAAGARLSEPACSQLIHRLLCELLLGDEGGGEHESVAAALRFIHSHLHQEISVKDAAVAAKLSPAHFSRVFKSRTGYSPYEYILLRRIDEAKQLLTSTHLSVKEVAYRVGYNSEENFIHSFQKKVGVPPGVFRNVPV